MAGPSLVTNGQNLLVYFKSKQQHRVLTLWEKHVSLLFSHWFLKNENGGGVREDALADFPI